MEMSLSEPGFLQPIAFKLITNIFAGTAFLRYNVVLAVICFFHRLIN